MLPTSRLTEPAALRTYHYFESADLDDTRERIAQVLQPHQLRAGASLPGRRAHMTHVRLDGMAFGTLAYSGAMAVEAGDLRDFYLIDLSLSGYADISVGSRRVRVARSQGCLCGPSTRFAGMFSSDCEQLLLRVEKGTMLAHAGYDTLVFDPVLDLSRPALAPWLAQLTLLLSSPDLVALARRERRVAVEVERLIVTLLLAGQPHSGQSYTRDTQLLPRTVRRAEEYIRENACGAIRLADIAQAARVPVRTLLSSFQRFRDATPMQYVREVRMASARERLLDAAPCERVADIALECGFINLGRFASAYKAKYGETPSDTLKYGRRRGGGLPA